MNVFQLFLCFHYSDYGRVNQHLSLSRQLSLILSFLSFIHDLVAAFFLVLLKRNTPLLRSEIQIQRYFLFWGEFRTLWVS